MGMTSSVNSLICVWRLLPNGTAEYKLNVPINCSHYDWADNGTIVASEGEALSAVLSHTVNSLYLRSPSPNVSLSLRDCQPSYKVFCNEPSDLFWIYALFWGLLVLVLLGFAVAIGICWYKKKGCFKRSHTPEAQDQEMVRMNNDQEQACV